MEEAGYMEISRCQVTDASQIMHMTNQKKPVEFYITLIEDPNRSFQI